MSLNPPRGHAPFLCNLKDFWEPVSPNQFYHPAPTGINIHRRFIFEKTGARYNALKSRKCQRAGHGTLVFSTNSSQQPFITNI